MTVGLQESAISIGELSVSPVRIAPCFVLLDSSYQVVGAEARLDALLKEAGLFDGSPSRLPAAIERVVNDLIAAAADDGEAFAEAAVPEHRLLVRSGILVGPSGNYVAVTLEKLRARSAQRGSRAI